MRLIFRLRMPRNSAVISSNGWRLAVASAVAVVAVPALDAAAAPLTASRAQRSANGLVETATTCQRVAASRQTSSTHSTRRPNEPLTGACALRPGRRLFSLSLVAKILPATRGNDLVVCRVSWNKAPRHRDIRQICLDRRRGPEPQGPAGWEPWRADHYSGLQVRAPAPLAGRRLYRW
jgi:hypothetical protein